jgi:streptogramin lyase
MAFPRRASAVLINDAARVMCFASLLVVFVFTCVSAQARASAPALHIKRVPLPAGIRFGESGWPTAYEEVSTPDGSLWFVQPGSAQGEPGVVKIVHVSPAGRVQVLTPSFLRLAPAYLSVGPDGTVWLDGCHQVPGGDSVLARVTPQGNVDRVMHFSASFLAVVSSGCLQEFVIRDDGSFWIDDNGQLASLGPSGGNLRPIVVGFPGYCAAARGADGNVWLVANPAGIYGIPQPGNQAVVRVGRDGTVTAFKVGPPHQFQACLLAPGPRRTMWSLLVSHLIAKITLDGRVAKYRVPGSLNLGMAAGPDGQLWLAGPGGLGEIATSGRVHQFAATRRLAPRALVTGTKGRLWALGPNAAYLISLR